MFFSSTPKLKIYVVDDEPEIRDIYSRLLKKIGAYEVKQFGTVAEVKDSILSEKLLPALIISDVKMPGECGLALKRFLSDYDLHVPLIHITALQGQGDLRLGYTILNKPVNVSEFNSVVRKALQIREAITE